MKFEKIYVHCKILYALMIVASLKEKYLSISEIYIIITYAVLHTQCIPRQLVFLRKSDCLGCAVLLCLVVCLTLLASFFLPSHLIKTCTYVCA